jgi:hypothetical protein
LARLLSAYSNKFPQLEDLRRSLSTCENTPNEPRKAETTSTPWAVRKRLSPAEINDLVEAFQAGTRQRDLAGQYAISLYSVKQLLAQAGARRYRIRGSGVASCGRPDEQNQN